MSDDAIHPPHPDAAAAARMPDAPFLAWFTGRTNIVLHAIDRHLSGPYRNKQALIWVGENGREQTYSYFSLHREVTKMANIIKSMGVVKGDRVSIYLPRIPEVFFAMLACAASTTPKANSSSPPTAPGSTAASSP